MKTSIKVTTLLFCAFLFSTITSCQKLKDQYELELTKINLTIINPYEYAIEVLNNFENDFLFIAANSSETISVETDQSRLQLSAKYVLFNTPLGSVEFDVKNHESYFWLASTNEINSLGNGDDVVSKDPFEDLLDWSAIGGGSGNQSGIVGKWSQDGGCINANGDRSYFRFNADKTGVYFNSDCNSACAGFGITFHFKYELTDNAIKINYTRTDSYCGIAVDTPKPETATYALSGNTLTINGTKHTR